ncbi:MAG: hypothetical protein QF864_17345, partial [SAR202 cluster bacterium]|nr:hypothetical protein [SAR202 cluster bacterium]
FSFQSWSKGDDITELEIEGISIGDTLLKLINKSDIKSNMVQLYKSKKFSTIAYYDSQIYDMVQFSFLTNDDNFIVHDIEGKLFFENNIEDCKKKQKLISKSIKEIIGSYTEYYPVQEQVRQSDPSGKSIMYTEAFLFSDQWSMVQIYCTDWSDDFEKDWDDELKISIWSETFSKFLEHEAYK